MRLPGVSSRMSCRRVKDSVSPSLSAANVTRIRSRAGAWISGSRVSVVMPARSCPTQPGGQDGGVAEERVAAAQAGVSPRYDRSGVRAACGYGDDRDRDAELGP